MLRTSTCPVSSKPFVSSFVSPVKLDHSLNCLTGLVLCLTASQRCSPLVWFRRSVRASRGNESDHEADWSGAAAHGRFELMFETERKSLEPKPRVAGRCVSCTPSMTSVWLGFMPLGALSSDHTASRTATELRRWVAEKGTLQSRLAVEMLPIALVRSSWDRSTC